MAEADAADAAEWYEEQQSGRLRSAFEDTLELFVDEICAAPMTFHKRRGEFRAAVMPRFPYLIHFRLQDDVIYVIAVAHGSRRPDYWWDREAEI